MTADDARPSTASGEPCLHDGDLLGRFEVDVCHGCGEDFSEQGSAEICTLCDQRLAVVGADVVRYVCGQCGYDDHLTIPQTTTHWRLCLLPLLTKVSR